MTIKTAGLRNFKAAPSHFDVIAPHCNDGGELAMKPDWAYSPNVLELEFCEVRILGILGSSPRIMR
jgi:hypothetical protein